MFRYQMIVYGRIQGVGFRFQVQRVALQHHLTGWVKNLDDGRVELEVQGDREQIEMFETKVKAGNWLIRVDHINKEPIVLIEKERDFKVFY